nr:MAG: Putative serine protease XkdF [Bacteriophage sp.]
MINVKVNKVDNSLRMVFGWGSICKKRNQETGQLEIYTDTDNEQFPEDVTLKAWMDFMNSDQRIMDNMHNEQPVGKVVFAFPMTEDIAASFGLVDKLDQTGVIVGTLITDDEVLKKFQTGEYMGYSIGGTAYYEDVE